MKESQIKHFNIAIKLIQGQIEDDNLWIAGQMAKTLGAILQSWAAEKKTRVYKKDGTIKKKYSRK